MILFCGTAIAFTINRATQNKLQRRKHMLAVSNTREDLSVNRRKYPRFKPSRSVLVKEDTGEIINYYHLRDISLGGMYLMKKISSNSERASKYTFLVPDVMETTVEGGVLQTRMNNDGSYGTAVIFGDPKALESVVRAIREL